MGILSILNQGFEPKLKIPLFEPEPYWIYFSIFLGPKLESVPIFVGREFINFSGSNFYSAILDIQVVVILYFYNL